MRTVAFIEAREPSTRLPRKHFERVGGNLLVEWPIKACLDTANVDATVVNTNSDEIANIARALGANTLHRPNDEKLMQDSKKMWWLRLYNQWLFENFEDDDDDTVILRVMGNAVILDPEAIFRLVHTMRSLDAAAGLVLTRVRQNEHPWYNCLVFSDGKSLWCRYHRGEATTMTDAEWPTTYRDDQSVYAYRLPVEGRVTKQCYSIATEPSHHVHTLYDLEHARITVKMLEQVAG